MKQQVAIITLGITNLKRSKQFYMEGFGWTPIYEDSETVMYQMNGFVLGTWLRTALEEDMSRPSLARGAAFSLAHNVASNTEVQNLLDRLAAAGGHILRNADSPPHGGLRGYVADPDDHAWEIICNPIWKADHRGWITYTPQTVSEV